MTRIVVHIGPWKTATTYIQRGLFANADLLARHGVYLPTAGRLELENNAVSHHHLAWELTGDRRFRSAVGGWDALTEELAGVDAETVLIASEAFDPAITAAGAGDQLEQRLTALSDDVTIVYVVRDQLSLINSTYGQLVKLFEEVGPFVPYVKRVLSSGEVDLERSYVPWIESDVIDFVAIPLPQLLDGDPLAAFLRAARIDVPADELVTMDEPVNTSLGPVGVEATRLLAKYLRAVNPKFAASDMAARKLHRMAAAQARTAGWCDDPYWGWPRGLAVAAAEQLEPSNQRFAHAAWGTDWSLPMPVDEPQARVTLMSLTPVELDTIHQYVATMAQRYSRMRKQQQKQDNAAAEDSDDE
ncbi:MAG: hypothetical protein ACR2KG_11700 [Nocardioidaceae bacterium]